MMATDEVIAEGMRDSDHANRLTARRLGIDTLDEDVIFMRSDCDICRAEGFDALSRVLVETSSRSIIATLYQVTSGFLRHSEAGLSESAWRRLGLDDGEEVTVSHPRPLESLSKVRSKVYGHRLDRQSLRTIVADIVAGRYSGIQLSSFITACSARPLVREEIVSLTHAMVDVGERLTWNRDVVVDKHGVGGLPGNRTTPIVVAIVAACGLTIPKTSSRAITSPSGTADTMETLTRVDLDISAMRQVVEREGGCIVWGGAVGLSPADDIMIRVERVLDLDSEGQLVASVLSKKIAAGATHVVLDMPLGPTAKVRSAEAAASLSRSLLSVAKSFGLKATIVTSDGSQPVGRGIGPALEARDVLAVLQRASHAPLDLRKRALSLAATILEMGGATAAGNGFGLASAVLDDGRAWEKFQRICEAQGGLRTPPIPAHFYPVVAETPGRVTAIDNRRLSMVAKLAGAPDAKASGVDVDAKLGDAVEKGRPLFTINAETPGELAYALDYARSNRDIFTIVKP